MAKDKQNGIAYSYNSKEFEYCGIVEAQESPLEPGVFLLPADATFQNPPKQIKGKAICFDVESQQWVQVTDNRGVYYNQDRQQIVIDEICANVDALFTKECRELTKEELAKISNNEIAQQIQEIEKQQLRSMRALLIKLCDYAQIESEELAKLKQYETSISEARNKLK